MAIVLLTLLVILIIISGWAYGLYVSVVKTKNAVLEAYSGIDVQLKKRYDLIPNLLTSAQKFMEHETEVFTRISELRSQAMAAKPGSKEQFTANAKLDTALSGLKVTLENYPQLKSDATIVKAMDAMTDIEDHIAASRRFYNSSITELRNIIQIFPGTLFAGFAGETANMAYYETDEASRQPIQASDYLK